jgi:hypothetical protein
MPKAKRKAECISDSDDNVPLFGPNCLTDKIKTKRNAECISDSDDNVPVFAHKIKARRKSERISDSDDNDPVFGPNCLADKTARGEAEQDSQQPFMAPEDYLTQEVAVLSQVELNAGAVDESEVRLGIAASLASTPSKDEVEVEVSRPFHDAEDVARIAAAKMIRFVGKDTIKIRG